MSDCNIKNDSVSDPSNSHLIKQKMATSSLYKNRPATSSSSRLKLNIETSNSLYNNKNETRSPYSLSSNYDDVSNNKKKRESLLLSTQFVPTRNRTGSFTPIERNSSNRVNSSGLISTTSPTSPSQSVDSSLNDVSNRSHLSLKDSDKDLETNATESSHTKMPRVFIQDDDRASFYSEALSPKTNNSKKIFFKSRRNTSVKNKSEDNSKMEYDLENLHRKDSMDSFVDVKEEQEKLVVERNLNIRLDKLIKALNKQYDQRDQYVKILNDTDKHIMQGSYTSEHINQYSKRLKTNTHIQQLNSHIRQLETEVHEVKQKLESLNRNKRSITDPHKYEMLNKDNVLSHRRSESYLMFSGEQKPHANMFLTPVQSTNAMFKDINPLSRVSDVQESNSYSNTKKDAISIGSKYEKTVEAETWEISDCLQSLQEKTLDCEFTLEKSNRLVELLKKSPRLSDELVPSAYIAAVQNMVLSDNSKVIAAGYRSCRYFFCAPGSQPNNISKMWNKSKIELSLIKSLTKTPVQETVMEMEQALKLIRGVMEITKTASLSIIQALISQLENSAFVEETIGTENITFVERENSNKTTIVDSGIELLLEICYLAPKNIVQTKCNRLLENIIIAHRNYEISKVITNTILNLLSMHESRSHYLNYFSFQFLFETFTSVVDKSHESSMSIGLIEKCMKLLSLVMKSFAGLMVFASNKFSQIKELVEFVKIPYLLPYLVDLFLDVLNISPISQKQGGKSSIIGRKEKELPILSQYRALLCKVFMECQLSFNIKNALATTSLNPDQLARCQLLVTEINKLCSDYFNDSTHQKLLEYIDEPMEKQEKLSIDNDLFTATISAYSQGVDIAYNLNKNEDVFDFLQFVRTSSSAQIEVDLIKKVDDVSFRNLIERTGVLHFKNYSQWDWSLLLVICRGMLKTNRRIDELNRNTKFIRRLIVFFRPYRFRFSGVPIVDVKNPDLIVDVGCSFFRALCETESGLKIFKDDLKFFPQIINSFYKLFEGIHDENVLVMKSLRNTMSSGYVKLLCSLTLSYNGVSLLNKWNIFSIIYKLFSFKTEEYEYLLCLFLREISLWKSPHSLLILKKAMLCESSVVKRFATDMIGYHLGILKKPDLPFKINNMYRNELNSVDERTHVNIVSSLTMDQETELLNMLIRQLYDIMPTVVAAADKILYFYSLNLYNNPISLTKHGFKRDISILVNLIEPMIDQLIMLHSPLLYLALTTKDGFELLKNKGYLNNERNKWLTMKNYEYANLMKQMFIGSLRYDSFDEMPVHLYKTLASSESGLRYIAANGDFVNFKNKINDFVKNLESSDVYNARNIMEIEGAVWCVGLIGSTDLGIDLIESTDVISNLITISMKAKNLSLKFTCLFALGFISSTNTGIELIDSFNWTCSVDFNGKPRGVCVPNDIDGFFLFPELITNKYAFDNREFGLDGSTDNLMYIENIFGGENTAQSSTDLQTSNSEEVEHFNSDYYPKGLGVISGNKDDDELKSGIYGIQDKEDKKSTSLKLSSNQPKLMKHKNRSSGQVKNEFYPDSSSSDIESFATDEESISSSLINEDIADSTPIEAKFVNEPANISVPVTKFKTEVLSQEEGTSMYQKRDDLRNQNLFNDLPNMTLNMDLDSLLFMRKIIEEPTLLNDENYETELELKKQETMIQSLNDFRFRNYQNLNSRKAFMVEMRNTRTVSEQNELMMQKISLLVSQLNNHLLLNESRRELMSYYKDGNLREFFSNSDIVNKVIDYMAIYKYSFQVRKFLCDLFLSSKSIEVVMKKDSVKMKYYDM
ncbi:hypothetical protein ACO0R3_001891 [Hanseniaspora guilliermondii]